MVCRLSFVAVLSPDNGPSCCFHYYRSSTISKTISNQNTSNPIWPIFIEIHIKYQQEGNAAFYVLHHLPDMLHYNSFFSSVIYVSPFLLFEIFMYFMPVGLT